MLINLLITNVATIGTETYIKSTLHDKNCEDEHSPYIRNIPIIAYSIEYLGDLIVLGIFASSLSYFVRKIKEAREEAGIKFTFYNKLMVLVTWSLILAGLI